MLAEFAGLLALDNVTGDVPALRRNAAEIVARLRARGVEAEAVGPDGVAPLIVGRVPGRPGAPRLGLYAHYDGQPVTPAEWATPPFEPTLIGPDGTARAAPGPGDAVDDEWRLHARAAADDKAPIVALLAALDAVAAAGAEREVELVLCLEGEEESGSTHLGELLTGVRRPAGRGRLADLRRAGAAGQRAAGGASASAASPTSSSPSTARTGSCTAGTTATGRPTPRWSWPGCSPR